MKLTLSAVILSLAVTAQASHGIMHTLNRVTPPTLLSNTPVTIQQDNLVYYGGPVISNARVQVVYWGANVDATVRQGMGAFYQAYVGSPQMDWMDQYNTKTHSIDGHDGTNQHIARGSYLGEVVITPKNTSQSLQDADIQAELEFQVGQSTLPKPDDNTVYMIHFPPGVKITIDGQASCSTFCAYHEGFKSKQYGNMFYGVMPDLGTGACSFGCSMGNTTFDSTTFVSAHELAEAVTDPFPTPGNSPAFPQAWNTKDGQEVADLCQQPSTLTSGGTTYTITKLWDNTKNSCSDITF